MIFIAILLGIIEGVTEWLPISSTGHLLIIMELLHIHNDPFMNMFLVVIQLGAILSVVYLFWKKINPCKKESWVLYPKIIIAILPITIIGFLLEDKIEKHFYNPLTISVMLILYGMVFLFIRFKGEKTAITFKASLIIGLFQVLSLIPGTSRSGVTIIGALLVGLKRKEASEFTFILALPIMLGASLLKIIGYGLNFTSEQVYFLVIGILVSFLVSFWSIRFLLSFITKHDFKAFGIYRIILGLIILLIFL